MQAFNFFSAQTPVRIHQGRAFTLKTPSLERCGWKFGDVMKTRKPYYYFVKKKK